MHKLEQLVHYSLQKLPVSPTKLQPMSLTFLHVFTLKTQTTSDWSIHGEEETSDLLHHDFKHKWKLKHTNYSLQLLEPISCWNVSIGIWYRKLVSKPSWYKLWFFRKRQKRKWLLLFHLKNLGYCPTIYIMFDAIIALLSLPRLISHRPRRSWRTELINISGYWMQLIIRKKWREERTS